MATWTREELAAFLESVRGAPAYPLYRMGANTGKSRRPISRDAETLRVLSEHHEAQGFARRSWGEAYRTLDLVFCRPDGAPLDRDTVRGRFERAAKRPGVRQILFHDVRHPHATLLLEAGVDISVVSRRIGHGDVGFAARVYAHVTA